MLILTPGPDLGSLGSGWPGSDPLALPLQGAQQLQGPGGLCDEHQIEGVS